MDTDMSHFELDREYTIVAVMGNDGYMYLFVDGDKVAEGNGMTVTRNGFTRRRHDGSPRITTSSATSRTRSLCPRIITVDVFDGEDLTTFRRHHGVRQVHSG